MTSRYHAVRLNQNLPTVSCEWDLELWKNGIFLKQKFFIENKCDLCHNVNFDVTIMTSLRNFFGRLLHGLIEKSYLGKVTLRNFPNLSPLSIYTNCYSTTIMYIQGSFCILQYGRRLISLCLFYSFYFYGCNRHREWHSVKVC